MSHLQLRRHFGCCGLTRIIDLGDSFSEQETGRLAFQIAQEAMDVWAKTHRRECAALQDDDTDSNPV